MKSILCLPLALTGCLGVALDSLEFTKNKPAAEALVGTWSIEEGSREKMREEGGYTVSQHTLELKADGTCSLKNMPDWWRTSFGESGKEFDSGEGTWEITPQQTYWDVALKFPGLNEDGKGYETDFVLTGEGPYRLWKYIGDADAGLVMVFEKAGKPAPPVPVPPPAPSVPHSFRGTLHGTWPKPWKIEASASFPEGLPSCQDILAEARALKDSAAARWKARKQAQVPGTYVGHYAGGVEVFEIRKDGSFTQTFLQDGKQVYTQDGKWSREDDRICFEPFVEAREPSKALDSSVGAWMSLWDNFTDGIILSDCEGIFILKQN